MDNLPPLYRDGVNYLEGHLKNYPGGAVPLKCLGEGTASSYSIMIYKTENQHTNKIERKQHEHKNRYCR
jgi:hypothetical protein